MYRAIHFRYSGPIRFEYDEEGNAVGAASEEFAKQISIALAEHGIQTSRVTPYENYGWEFVGRFGDRSFQNVLHPIEGEASLTVDLGWLWLETLLGRRPRNAWASYCAVVRAALASVPGVEDAEWSDYYS